MYVKRPGKAIYRASASGRVIRGSHTPYTSSLPRYGSVIAPSTPLIIWKIKIPISIAQLPDPVVQLLQSWIDGDAEEQRETGEYLMSALDEDRLSDRKLFP
jgi:hypothetical protein